MRLRRPHPPARPGHPHHPAGCGALRGANPNPDLSPTLTL